ncbi:hypothetical protein R0131_17730 [Clostridium sp. AL.422]|uniref:hypothetical protein n=1 Tax=Clostridium TaxID=1485 RepID=UPI00293DFDCD|nr:MULTISPECIES: hypothetical protein [unclassified Clostridium]MDV4152672.1 hypothetical protein [Clostridium sp. AL.422]
MKYGIDINSEKISSFITDKLKSKGNFIVNFNEKNSISTGRTLLKKVLIAYITKIDFYFAIDFKENIVASEIFYSECDCSILIGRKLLNIFDDILQEVICEKGEHLYLIKNIDAPVVYIRIPLEEKEKLEEFVINKIITLLESIKI